MAPICGVTVHSLEVPTLTQPPALPFASALLCSLCACLVFCAPPDTPLHHVHTGDGILSGLPSLCLLCKHVLILGTMGAKALA